MSMRRAYATGIRASHRRIAYATDGRTDVLTDAYASHPPQPIFHVRTAHARTTIMTSLGELP